RFQLILTYDSQFTWVFTAPNQAMERLSGHYKITPPRRSRTTWPAIVFDERRGPTYPKLNFD
ncbi:MAG: hypothetical protein NTV81_02820, partial [Candidatus Komeilibacteria bacterium]|nr:hypothetical protein [Candidatus Komeilibacteria bacterium]